MTTSSIYIKNASTLVTDEQAATMTRAVAYAARFHAAPAWGYAPRTILFQGVKASPPTAAAVITLYDDSDQAGDLGWHTDENGTVYGKVFVRPSLDSGSTLFSGDYAVSSVLSHEVLETIFDPSVSYWADAGQDQAGGSIMYAFEVCDPVENGTYTVRDVRNQIAVSNFILPAWFDPQARRGPFDYLGQLSAPFSIAPGGYVVRWTSQGQSQQFGEAMPEWRRELKRLPSSRGARRAGLDRPEGEGATNVPTTGGAGVLGRMLGKLREEPSDD